MIYDNQGKEVSDMDFTTTHADHFKIHEKRGHKARNVTKSVIHRIKTTHSLQVLRRSVKTILNTNHCQVIYHHWKETEPDIIQLGHIIGIHPNHHSREEAQALVAKSITDATMPQFRLVYSTPSISTTTGESRTKAYALEILRKDRDKAMSSLEKAFKPNQHIRILLGKMRYSSPEAYVQGLTLQNEYLSSRYIVQLSGISSAMMFYMKDHLQAIQGVLDIVTTPHTQVHGKWNIIVDKAKFLETRNAIQQALPRLLTLVEPDARPQDGTYTTPPIIHMRNDDTSRKNSLLTMSTQSFLTTATKSNTQSAGSSRHCTNHTINSWAEVASRSAPPTNPAAPTPIPPNKPPTPFSVSEHVLKTTAAHAKEIQELRLQIQKLEALLNTLVNQLQQPHHDSRPQESEAMEEKAKRDSSEIVNTPPKTPSKRQKAHTATPPKQDEEVQMDVSHDSQTHEAPTVAPHQHTLHPHNTPITSTNQSAKMLKQFFDRYRAVAAD